MRAPFAIGLIVLLASLASACGDERDQATESGAGAATDAKPGPAAETPIPGVYEFDADRTFESREAMQRGTDLPPPDPSQERKAIPFAGYRLHLQPDGTFRLGVNFAVGGQKRLVVEGTWKQVGQQLHFVTRVVDGEPADEETASIVDVYDVEPGYLSKEEKDFVVYLRRVSDPGATNEQPSAEDD